MSAQQTDTAALRRQMSYLTKDYMPEARWTVEGAFRFDLCLRTAIHFFENKIPVRQIHTLAGVLPCLWSLDWISQRRPLTGASYIQKIETYCQAGVGLVLVFDNPHIREEDLKDAYGIFLVTELARRNGAHKHAVCVANDRLAAQLRKLVPNMPIYCHMNRLLAEPATTQRDAAFYNRLAQLYNRVCLHPEDAVNPAIYGDIAEPARMDVVINDACLRSCPLRREHLRVLADYRQEPYNPLHGQKRIALMNQAGCQRMDAGSLQQKRMGNLTKAESRALYAAGYRSFIIQSHQYRSEMTLLWDIVQCMFEATPALDNKIALINTNLMSSMHPKPRLISSGLSDFSSLDYD